MENMRKRIAQNSQMLNNNTYPGRGMIIGLTPDQKHLVQVYWIMGRSENSQNRVFVEERGFVRTEAHDPSKLIDPSLIIYSPIKFIEDKHIVSNGDQTDTIYNAIKNGKSFEEALNEREFEPDPPNYTPRISGIIDVGSASHSYKLSILKSFYNNPEYCIRNVFNYSSPVSGIGHCITTYSSDGDPIPSFEGEPFILELFDDIDVTLNHYWNLIDSKHKVAILVKFINTETKETAIKIINKHI